MGIGGILARSSARVRRELLNRFSPKWANQTQRRYWESLENAYEGWRGFVIGNGPSLAIKDLDRIANEITIASNKITLAFPATGWRPTVYTVCDELVAKKISKELAADVSNVHVPIGIGAVFPGCDVRYWRTLPAPQSDPLPGGPIAFSPDPVRGFNGGYSVTYANLQLAAFMGLNPVYIIGCDHHYAGESDPTYVGKIGIPEEGTHFHPEYRKKGEEVNAAPIRLMNAAFEHAAEYSRTSGLKIFNATRGGYLEAFPRVDFESLF